jgi:hypothetical protein
MGGGESGELCEWRQFVRESAVVDPYGIQGTWMRVVCFLGICPSPFPIPLIRFCYG